MNDRVVVTRDGDVRPAVVGAFSDLDTGVTLTLTADTRFQTTISPLKAAVAVVGVLALLGLLVALHRCDATRRKAPRRDWRPRLVDLAVAAALGVWWVIGAVTVDDGYIAGIIRSRGENGFIGNVYRWLNAPESPFSWFYDVLYPWSQVSASTLWMRLPATLLGVVTWVLLSRYALPRLGVRRPWLAALAFLTWWVPLCLGLRPEPWVAAGLLGCWVLVERAVATRRLLPLVLGLVLAGATTALTPGGLVAFTPFLGGLRPIVRLLRARSDLHRWPLVAALVAAPASAVLLMVYDQSFGAMLESTRVRSLIGGGAPWYEEAERYAQLMTDSFQGSIGRRAAVLVTLLAAAAVLMAVRRGPKHRMVVTFLLALAVMTFTPTKWTQHFGDLAGVGAAVLVLGAVTARRDGGGAGGGRRRRRVGDGGAEQLAVRVGLVHPVVLDDARPGAWRPGGDIAAGGGRGWRVLVVGLARRWAAPPDAAARVVVLVVALALQVLGLARVAVAHRDSYTLASDAVATLRGDPCGPAAHPLGGDRPRRRPAARPGRRPRPPRHPVDIGGSTLPGFVVDRPAHHRLVPPRPGAAAGSCRSSSRRSGTLRPGDDVRLEFGARDRSCGAGSPRPGAHRRPRSPPQARRSSGW